MFGVAGDEHRHGQRQPRGAAHAPATSPPRTRRRASPTRSIASSWAASRAPAGDAGACRRARAPACSISTASSRRPPSCTPRRGSRCSTTSCASERRRGQAVRPVRRGPRLHALRRRQAARSTARASFLAVARHRRCRTTTVRGPGRSARTIAARDAARASTSRPTTGSVRYVRAAREAGLRTAVVSSSKHCQRGAGLGRHRAICSTRASTASSPREQHLAGKPAPDTFLAAARALGVEPDAGGRVRGRARRRRGRPGRALRLRRRRRSRGSGRRAAPARRRRRRAPTWPRCWRQP